MDSEVTRLQRIFKRFDKDLTVRRSPDGVARLIQKIKKLKGFDVDGLTIYCPVEEEHLIFSFTDDFSAKGKPVEWGHEPLFHKMRQIALDRRDALFRELEEESKKKEEKKDRDQFAKFEDIAHETRDIYKKTFSDVLTHSMDKSKDPRRRLERSKYGNS